MAIKRTSTGYQIRWYAPDGKERKRTYKGISRELAEQKEREILHKRDYGKTTPNPRQAPTLEQAAQEWIEQHRPEWKTSTFAQYQNILKTNLTPTFGTDRVSHILPLNVPSTSEQSCMMPGSLLVESTSSCSC